MIHKILDFIQSFQTFVTFLKTFN